MCVCVCVCVYGTACAYFVYLYVCISACHCRITANVARHVVVVAYILTVYVMLSLVCIILEKIIGIKYTQ